MNDNCDFYICPVCFQTAESPRPCHKQMMLHCSNLSPGDRLLKPDRDADGNLKSRAPRWFIRDTYPDRDYVRKRGLDM